MNVASFKAAGGLRNTVYPERLTTQDLVVAKNIDLDDSGAILRRKGVTKLIDGDTHSLYSLGSSGLMVQGGVMKQWFPDGTSHVVTGGIRGAVSYATIMGQTFWSDRYSTGIVEGGVNRQWGITPPNPPTLSVGVGELPAGKYSVAVTFTSPEGRESGARESIQIELLTVSGITVDISNSPIAGVAGFRVYVSPPDGSVLYYYGEYDISQYQVTVGNIVSNDLPLRNQFYGEPPAGQIVAFFAGRIYIAKDNYLFYSKPFEYELYDMRFSYVPFEDYITMVAPVTNGIFLSTTKQVNFLQGMTPEEFKTAKVYDFGAIEGTSRIVKADYIIKDAQPDPCAVWLGVDGVCVGLAVGQSNNLTGTVKNLTAEKYAMRLSATSGASILKLRDGTPHFVVSYS